MWTKGSGRNLLIPMPLFTITTMQLIYQSCQSCSVSNCKSQFPSRSALTFIRIISTARKNISQNLKVGEVLQQNSLKAVNKGESCSRNRIDSFDKSTALVKWSMPEKFESHVLRLGGFHTLSCFMSALGKIWATAGLRDLLVDSGVNAGCTVDQILQCKQFNRGVRAYIDHFTSCAMA
jgi:hypothetical protein